MHGSMPASHLQVVFVAAVVLAASAGPVDAQEMTDRRPTTLSGRSTVYAPNGAVATSQPLATAAGLRVLQEGGNAVDAAVTAAAVLGLVEPHMTGIGGDAFALLWKAGQDTLLALESTGRAGSRSTVQAIRDHGFDRMPYRAPEAVTVPGALAAWAELLEEHGTISLARALEPAIRLAEDGFPVSPIIARQWRAQTEVLERNGGARATYLPGGRAPEAGEWFRNPDLAESYRLIAREGPGALYGGELGRRIVRELERLGGFLTLEDLEAHQASWVEPVSADFRGYTLWELPPPNQGIAALEMLRILEPYDLKAMGHNSAAYLHHLVEAKKLAFADMERHVGDPDAMEIQARELLDDSFVKDRRALLDPERAADRVQPGAPMTESETIYLSVADADGNMVSFINSVFEYFGSGIVVPGTGFVLQNRGAGFTLEEDHPNRVAPGKKPFHTLIPAFVTREGRPWLAYGVMGGSMQPQGHVQMLLNLLVFEMDLQEAVDAPRFRSYDGLRLALEAPISEEVRAALEAMGHELLDESEVAFGGAQAVMRVDGGGWAAGSDPRKDGMAAGH